MRNSQRVSQTSPIISIIAALGLACVGLGCGSAGTMSRIGSSVEHAVNFSGVPPQTEPKIEDDAPPKRK